MKRTVSILALAVVSLGRPVRPRRAGPAPGQDDVPVPRARRLPRQGPDGGRPEDGRRRLLRLGQAADRLRPGRPAARPDGCPGPGEAGRRREGGRRGAAAGARSAPSPATRATAPRSARRSERSRDERRRSSRPPSAQQQSQQQARPPARPRTTGTRRPSRPAWRGRATRSSRGGRVSRGRSAPVLPPVPRAAARSGIRRRASTRIISGMSVTDEAQSPGGSSRTASRVREADLRPLLAVHQRWPRARWTARSRTRCAGSASSSASISRCSGNGRARPRRSSCPPTPTPPRKDPQAPEPLHEEQFPWYRQQMLAGRRVAISSLEDLPPEAAVDRESCRLVGVKSNLCLPLPWEASRPSARSGSAPSGPSATGRKRW